MRFLRSGPAAGRRWLSLSVLLATYAGLLALIAAGGLAAAEQAARLIMAAAEPRQAGLDRGLRRTRSAVLGDSDDWAAKLRTDRFWAESSKGQGGASGLGMRGAMTAFGVGVPFDGSLSSGGAAFRTVCVRLCDGFFWPISYATQPAGFDRDNRQCQSSCSSPAKLYVARTSGTEAEALTDMRGEPYTRLKTAFLFRSRYDESCKCKPHPWEKEATDRHRLYAQESSRRKGNRLVETEIGQIRSRQGAIASAAGPLELAALATAAAGPKTVIVNGSRAATVLPAAPQAGAEAGNAKVRPATRPVPYRVAGIGSEPMRLGALPAPTPGATRTWRAPSVSATPADSWRTRALAQGR